MNCRNFLSNNAHVAVKKGIVVSNLAVIQQLHHTQALSSNDHSCTQDSHKIGDRPLSGALYRGGSGVYDAGTDSFNRIVKIAHIY